LRYALFHAVRFFFCSLGVVAIGGSSYIKLVYAAGSTVVPSCGGVVVVMALLRVAEVIKATALVHRSWSLDDPTSKRLCVCCEYTGSDVPIHLPTMPTVGENKYDFYLLDDTLIQLALEYTLYHKRV
jgi:hypothetical protein